MTLVAKDVLLVLAIVLGAVSTGCCAKCVDWRGANVEQLRQSLCPDMVEDLKQCELDLTEANSDCETTEVELLECLTRE